MFRLQHLRASLLLAVTAACGPGLASKGSGLGTDAEGPGTDAEGPSTSGESSGTSGEEGPTCPLTCEDPEAISDGYVRCADGAINRVSEEPVDPLVGIEPCQGDEDYIECLGDEDCGDGSYCKHEPSVCYCETPCVDDSDCLSDEVCLTGGLGPYPLDTARCVFATCKSNADCGECGECGVGFYNDECGQDLWLSCRDPSSECRADSDCAGFDFACFTNPDGVWTCQEPNSCAVPGRPMLVDSLPRVASTRRRGDWSARVSVGEDLELAEHWAEVAALEHASVASFARFTQQLLALGAPPQLIRAAQRAAIDEIEHARLAFGLARAYGGGAEIGPGRLELTGVEVSGDWREIVGALIHEACVGETLNVVEALAALESVESAPLRAVLERVALDEERHAALAWRALAWLVRGAKDDDRRWLLATLERALARASVSPSGLHRPAEGVLGGPTRARIRQLAVREVLEPLRDALTKQRSPARA